MSLTQSLNRKAIDLGKLAVEMTTAAGSGHPSSALSLAHLVAALLYHQMRWDPKDPWNPAADRLVLSEGHAVPILYAAMADLGVMIGKSRSDARPMTRQDAMSLRAIGSPIDGHPNPGLGVPFFDAATGSLGQGLSVAAGLAIAARRDAVDRNIYCLIGDGESREGQIWEAMDFIADHELTNCIPIFNCNELAQSDWVSAQQSAATLAEKAGAFGLIAAVVDGHDPEQVLRALAQLPVIQNGHKPLAIIARTVKGWGSNREQGMGHHGQAIKPEQLQPVLEDLNRTAQDLGVAQGGGDGELVVRPPAARPAPLPPRELRIDFESALEQAGLLANYKAGKPVATRQAYGAALLALAGQDRRVVGLDADVKNSTFAEYLAKKIPSQFIECRIAEQNMVSVAAGLSAAGKIPFCSTFAKFFIRAYDQVEMAINTGANFKLTGSHAGVTLAADGPSQMALPDVAFFRAFCHATNYAGEPAMRYFFPCDAVSCARIVELMANLYGPCYLRTLRSGGKAIYKPDAQFEAGGFKVLREGKDALIVSAGYMVHESLRAADELARSGRQVSVVDAYSFPLKTRQILELAQRSGSLVVTVEDNYAGGLEAEIGSAIAQSGAAIRLRPLFVGRIPKSGREADEVLKWVGLDTCAIMDAMK